MTSLASGYCARHFLKATVEEALVASRQTGSKMTMKPEKEDVSPGEKFYTIVGLAYDYNDEYYNRTDGHNLEGKMRLFRSQEKAQEECDRMNGKWARTEGKDIRTEEGEACLGYEVIEVEIGKLEDEK